MSSSQSDSNAKEYLIHLLRKCIGVLRFIVSPFGQIFIYVYKFGTKQTVEDEEENKEENKEEKKIFSFTVQRNP